MAKCLTPIWLKKDGLKEMEVPCNRCPNCRQRRASGWSFRLQQEEKVCKSAHFITLTYDTKSVPFNNQGKQTLRKRDLQLFFKRLRKAMGKKGRSYIDSNGKLWNFSKVRYYAVGEYGDKTWRPHYHLILFNAPIELIQNSWARTVYKRERVMRKRAYKGERYKFVDTKKTIHLGSVYYGTVTGASIAYALKYISKEGKIPFGDSRKKEFSLMSKGLGKNYLTPQMISWHLANMEKRQYCVMEGGTKVSMPRYYKSKIYNAEQLGIMKGANEKRIKQKMEENYKKALTEKNYCSNHKEGIKAAFNRMNYRNQLNKIL